MSLLDDILDTSQLHLEGDFDTQVDYLLQQVRLTRNEVERLSNLFDDLEATLRIAWPGCRVMPFGSIITGLGIRTSDVDCYVSLPRWVRTPPDKIVYKAKHVLMRQENIFTDIIAIPMAKVPIVKFYHVPNGKHCDVSFKSPSGVQNSKLIAYLLHLDERALPLAILIKYWAKVHKLTGTNLMSNYSLMLLMIFYLQQVNVLPPVYILQDSVPENVVDNWNTAFREIPNYKSNNEDSLYKLMGGFFEYYKDFNFAGNIVSPYLGFPLAREVFKKLEYVPNEFTLYKDNLLRGACLTLKLDTRMCVQDPFDHSRNCCVAVFPKLAEKLIVFFQNAAKMFREDRNNNFLKGILTQTPIAGAGSKKKNKGPGRVQKRNEHNQNIKMKRTMNNVNTLFEHYNKWKKGKR